MELNQPEGVPRWAWKLLLRLGQLKRGKVYRLTLFVLDGEPVWTLEEQGKLENERAQSA